MRKNLMKWEIDKGYKGVFIAKKLGIASSTWSNIKSGRVNPTYELLSKFQKEFDVENIIELFEKE